MELKRADSIEKPTPEEAGVTEEQLRQRRIGKAIRAQRAKRQAVAKATGTDDGVGSADLASRLEASTARAREDSAKRFKAKQAVASQLRKRTGGDAA